MTRIDFYQISGDETAFACRLIDLVYRRGHQIYVHTSTEERASILDEQLWTFKEEAFIPHSLLTGSPGSDALHSDSSGSDSQGTDSQGTDFQGTDFPAVPIKIGFDHEPEEHQDVLINLSGKIPHFFSRFDRVAEVVPVDQNSRKAARENYAYYKERGYVLNYHEMKQ